MKKITKQIITVSIGFALICGGVLGINTFISINIPSENPSASNPPFKPDKENHEENHNNSSCSNDYFSGEEPPLKPYGNDQIRLPDFDDK